MKKLTTFLAFKSIVMIIAISFSGSQVWAKDWSKEEACADPVIKEKKEAACMEPIKATPGSKDMEYMIKFDFKWDGCLPSAGVSKAGVPNPGIAHVGSPDGSCAFRDQLDYGNTMYRIRCKPSDGKEYCVRMFALYFVKDQNVPGPRDQYGHTNDWEFGLIWTTNNQLTHASYSEHGHVKTKKIEDLYPVTRQATKVVFMDYYKDGTHTMRLPKESEATKRKDDGKLENPSKPPEWVTPNIVNWNNLEPNLRETFIAHDYGSADMPMTPKNFYSNIIKGFSDGTSMLKKAGYPSELYSELPASDFEGVWIEKGAGPDGNITLTVDKPPMTVDNSNETLPSGRAATASGSKGTWKEEGGKGNSAVITWTEPTKFEKTKIAKERGPDGKTGYGKYQKSDYRVGERLENPTTNSVEVLPPERCPAPSGQSICQ
jgi:hypothetical protein